VSKPFSFAELAARARSVLGRAQGQAEKTEKTDKSDKNDKIDKSDKNDKIDKNATLPLLQHGDLVVDLATRRVWRQRELLHLTPTEFKLLVTLMQHVGQVLTPQDLVRSVWGEQYLDDVGYVRRYVWHLRKKIEPDPTKPSYIHNEHGFGYRFFPAPQSTDTPVVGD
jgi:DNA-binding response OmpR family regulator